MTSDFTGFVKEYLDEYYNNYPDRDLDSDPVNHALDYENKNINSSPNNPFKFFDWFFTRGGLYKFLDYFNSASGINKEDIISEKFNADNLSWEYQLKTTEDEVMTFTRSFEGELLLLFKEKFSESISTVKYYIDKIFNSVELDSSIKYHHDKVIAINIRIDDVPDTYLPAFEKYLQGLKKSATKALNSHLSKNTKMKLSFSESLIAPDISPSLYLGVKKNSKNIAILNGFYNLDFIHGKFIDQDKTHINTFINYFTEDLITPSQFKIYCSRNCQTKQGSYIIRQMNIIFNSPFTYEDIEQSKSFIKPKGKLPFTAGDLSHGKHCQYEFEINNEIEGIKREIKENYKIKSLFQQDS